MWWLSRRKGSLCPYTGLPLRHARTVSFFAKEKTARFLADLHQYDNQVFLFKRASFCRDTGRIFPDCVKRELVRLDWSFLRKRYPGNFVSWGSLNEIEQSTIKLCHETMAGFQTERSCPNPMPEAIDTYHALLKPGPLYVDRQTKILMGWKEVGGTEFEVLIVQKPIYQSVDETL